VKLTVYDVEGRLVRTLIDTKLPPGEFEARWDGRGNGGAPVAAGVYFYRLTTPDGSETKKMVLLN
jgi:flagellar hook assembly protein FlgD